MPDARGTLGPGERWREDEADSVRVVLCDNGRQGDRPVEPPRPPRALRFVYEESRTSLLIMSTSSISTCRFTISRLTIM
jgi:hypothetical protein